jgi:hypothetical protein
MSDVVASVTAVLSQTSLQVALQSAVPGVLQRHLQAMAGEARQRLLPSADDDGADMPLPSTQVRGSHEALGHPHFRYPASLSPSHTAKCAQHFCSFLTGICISDVPLARVAPLHSAPQDIAHAVHALSGVHSPAATHAALEEAMQCAARHVLASAEPAMSALLPADVPQAARSAAAALAVEGCLAACAQRLLQQVPSMVHAQLSQQADQLVKVIGRQLAVHARMVGTGPLGNGSGGGAPASLVPAAAADAGASCGGHPGASATAAGAGANPPAEELPHTARAGAGAAARSAPLAAAKQGGPSTPAAPRRLPTVDESAALGASALAARLQAAGGSGGSGCGDTPTAVAAAATRARRRITPMRVEPLPAGSGGGAPSRLRSSPLPMIAALEAARALAPGSGAVPGGGAAPRTPISAAAAARLSSRMCSSPLPLMPAAEAPALPVTATATAALATNRVSKPSASAWRAPSPILAVASPGPRQAAVTAALDPRLGRPTALESAFAAVSLDAAAQGSPFSPPRCLVRGANASPAKPHVPQAERIAAAVLSSSTGAAEAVLAALMGCEGALAAGGVSEGSSSSSRDVGEPAAAAVAKEAASRCVEAVQRGEATVTDIEQRLMLLLSEAQQQQVAAAGEGQVPASPPAGASAAMPRGAQLQERVLLLCGAVLHAWLSSPYHERAVWSADEAAAAAAASDSEGALLPPALQAFGQLPGAMMKAVRGGCRLAVLRRLRLWLQDATLGDPGLADSL